MGVDDVTIYFDPPHISEQKLDHPPNDGGEFITKCSDGKIVTEKCIRGSPWNNIACHILLFDDWYIEGGGYMTTVKEKERADKIAAECKRKYNWIIAMLFLSLFLLSWRKDD